MDRYKTVIFKNVEDGISDNNVVLNVDKETIVQGLIDSDKIFPSTDFNTPAITREFVLKKTIPDVSYSIDEVDANSSSFFTKDGTLYKATLNDSDSHIHLYKLLTDTGSFSYVGDAGFADLFIGAFTLDNKIIITGDFSSSACVVSDDNGATWSDIQPTCDGDDIGPFYIKPVFLNGKFYFFDSFVGFSLEPAVRSIYTTTDFETFEKVFDSPAPGWEIDSMFEFLGEIYIFETKSLSVGGNIYTRTSRLSRFDEVNGSLEMIKYVENVQSGINTVVVFQGRICIVLSDGRNRKLWIYDGMNKRYKTLEQNQDLRTSHNWILGVSDDFLFWTDGVGIHIFDKNFAYFRNFLELSNYLGDDEEWQDYIVYQNNFFVSFYDEVTKDERIFHFNTSDEVVASGSITFPTIKDNEIIPKQVILYHKQMNTGAKIEVYYSSLDSTSEGLTFTKLGEENDSEDTRYVLDFPKGLVFDRITLKVIIHKDEYDTTPIDDFTVKFLYNTKNLDS